VNRKNLHRRVNFAPCFCRSRAGVPAESAAGHGSRIQYVRAPRSEKFPSLRLTIEYMIAYHDFVVLGLCRPRRVGLSPLENLWNCNFGCGDGSPPADAWSVLGLRDISLTPARLGLGVSELHRSPSEEWGGGTRAGQRFPLPCSTHNVFCVSASWAGNNHPRSFFRQALLGLVALPLYFSCPTRALKELFVSAPFGAQV